MQLKTLLLVAVTALSGAEACYFTVTSSTVGTFSVRHSEPSDHGGQPQTMSGGKGGCRFTAGIADGCRVTVRSSSGCGTLRFQSVHE